MLFNVARLNWAKDFCRNKSFIRFFTSEKRSDGIELPEPLRLSSHKVVGKQGSLPNVLIFHGAFGSKHNWKGLTRQISELSGRTVHALDLRNHGDSPHSSPDDANYLGMASDIRLFLEEHQLEKVQLIGHSMGGRAAQQFSFLYVRFPLP